jgi:acyl carrier protein
MEARAAVLGARMLGGEFEALRSLDSELFSELRLGPQLDQVVGALRQAASLTVGGPTASRHWLEARAGELTTWIILYGAVERKRRVGSTADLERTAAWVRSNLETSLSETRQGPPPEVRLGGGFVGDAIASYDRSLGGLESEIGRDAAQARIEPRDLRGWAVAWLAERLRVEESRIDPHRSFADHGVDSLAAVEFAKALADRVGVTLDETLLWNFPTIDSLLSYLEKPRPADSRQPPPATAAPAASEQRSSDASAIDEELERLERELEKRS